jgi:phosphotransferase system HPr-like phosphotransfer protein
VLTTGAGALKAKSKKCICHQDTKTRRFTKFRCQPESEAAALTALANLILRPLREMNLHGRYGTVIPANMFVLEMLKWQSKIYNQNATKSPTFHKGQHTSN